MDARRHAQRHIARRDRCDPSQPERNPADVHRRGQSRGFFEPCTGIDFPDFIMPFFTRNDDDVAYGLRALERADCVSDNWFARNYGKQFIEAHPLTAAGGYDDG